MVTPPLSVLVVDDHPGTAESLADLLGLHGHRVTVAHTAREALAVADRVPPDLAFLDLRLPDMDGWQVARWLREQARLRHQGRLRLVAVTGCNREEDYQRSTAAGIDFHLVKPVDPDVLMRVLTGCLDHDGKQVEGEADVRPSPGPLSPE